MRRSFFSQLEERDSRIALIADVDQFISYRELAMLADQSVSALGHRRRLVLIGMAPTIDCVAAYLGALRAGHAAILIDPNSHERIDSLVKTFGVEARFDPINGSWDQTLGASANVLHEDLAVLLGTSGSSGATKLVRLSEVNITSNACAIAEYLGIKSESRAITSLPLFYSYGLSVINSHLAAGASVLLTDASVVSKPFWSSFDRFEVTSIAGVPYTYQLLEQSGFRERRHPSLTTMTQAGGRLAPELVAEFGEWAKQRNIQFYVMYGQTEATARIAYVPPEQLADNLSAIGRAIPGGTLFVEDEHGGVAPNGVAGELIYMGPNVMLGYARERRDLALGPDTTELRTGDLAVQQPNGLFKLVGRKSRICKPFGVRVALDDLEAQIRTEGLDATVAGNDELIGVAFTGTLSPDSLTKRIAQVTKLPASVFETVPFDVLPRLPSGKPDYQAVMRAATAARQARQQHGPPSDLLGVYQKTLPFSRVTREDSFTSIGGDSLAFVNVSSEVEERLGHLPGGWERMSIATLEGLARPSEQRQFASIDTDVLLRLVAMIIVVSDHARDTSASRGIFGGAELFLLLAGVSFWRFQLGAFADDRFRAVLKSFAVRIVAPVYILTLAYSLVWENLHWSSLTLVSTFFGRYKSLLEPFWFVETLFHCYALLWLLSKLSFFRHLAEHRDFRLGIWLVAVGALVQAMGEAAFDHQGLGGRTFDVLFLVVAVGAWAGAAETLWQRLAVLATAAILFHTLPTASAYNIYPALLGLLVLMTLRTIKVPTVSRKVLIYFAAASYPVYIAHSLPIWVINKLGGRDLEGLKIIIGIAAGLLLAGLLRWGEALFVSLRRRDQPGRAS